MEPITVAVMTSIVVTSSVVTLALYCTQRDDIGYREIK